MTHLFISREYPPAPYPAGGIGTYLRHITRLLAIAGETVHVVAHRWRGASQVREEFLDGRLIVHRVALDDEHAGRALVASSFPSQAFAWQAAMVAERLIEREGIDVIEAQEWEAPLHYLQLRRSLGLGPARQPPCVVHVHSPSESIFAANEWDRTVADYGPAVALEAQTIAAADALLCPSRYVADQVTARYGLDPSRITVIPYPLGDAAPIVRDASTWSNGSICFVGRLELRKGVLEWVDAVSAVAADHPDVRVDLIGHETPFDVAGGPTVGDIARQRMSRSVRRRFRFLGPCDRGRVRERLSHAWSGVIPSRWENLPYSCIESMASGLPVIVSPEGGMRELVADGVSGWIAPNATAEGLAQALDRALATGPADRARMGAAAAAAVERVCNNERVVAQHLEVKRRLMRRAGRTVIAVPVSIEPAAQTAIAVVEKTDAALATAAAKLAADPSLCGVAFVDRQTRLDPAFLPLCREAFARDSRLGVLSAWMLEAADASRIRIPPAPDRPHAWDAEAAPCVAVRADAFRQAHARTDVLGADAVLRLCDEILRLGWAALTYPSVLASLPSSRRRPPAADARYSSMAQGLRRLHMPFVPWLLSCAPKDRRLFVRDGFRHPARAAQRLAGTRFSRAV